MTCCVEEASLPESMSLLLQANGAHNSQGSTLEAAPMPHYFTMLPPAALAPALETSTTPGQGQNAAGDELMLRPLTPPAASGLTPAAHAAARRAQGLPWLSLSMRLGRIGCTEATPWASEVKRAAVTVARQPMHGSGAMLRSSPMPNPLSRTGISLHGCPMCLPGALQDTGLFAVLVVHIQTTCFR